MWKECDLAVDLGLDHCVGVGLGKGGLSDPERETCLDGQVKRSYVPDGKIV